MVWLEFIGLSLNFFYFMILGKLFEFLFFYVDRGDNNIYFRFLVRVRLGKVYSGNFIIGSYFYF